MRQKTGAVNKAALIIQIIIGIGISVVTVPAFFILSLLAHAKFFGWQIMDIGGSGDKSPFTFLLMVIFFMLIFAIPILIWMLANWYGQLRFAGKKFRNITFVLFAALPLLLAAGVMSFFYIERIYYGYLANRHYCAEKNGFNRKTFDNGVRVEVVCRNGIYHGAYKEYDAGGKLVSVETYDSGSVKGPRYEIDQKGSTVRYQMIGDETSKMLYWQMAEGNLSNLVNEAMQEKLCKKYIPNPDLQYSYRCVGTTIDGDLIVTDANEKPVLKTHLTKGVLNGQHDQYMNGNPRQHLEFRNGILHGKVASYSMQGILEYEGQYVDGLQEGIFRMYDQNGKLDSEVVFERGMIAKVNYPILN